MKWTEDQTERLKAMAMDGASNAEIASALKLDPEQVYRKRKALGITAKQLQLRAVADDLPGPKNGRACPCNNCAAWCYAAGSQQVVINCPKYISPVARRLEHMHKAKRVFLDALCRPPLPGGHNLISRSELDELKTYLDNLIGGDRNG